MNVLLGFLPTYSSFLFGSVIFCFLMTNFNDEYVNNAISIKGFCKRIGTSIVCRFNNSCTKHMNRVFSARDAQSLFVC